MLAAAGNNMVVGTDLALDTTNTATQLFTLTATGASQTELARVHQIQGSAAIIAEMKKGLSHNCLYYNYIPEETTPEVTDAEEVNEEDDFINTISVLNGPIDIAYKYLKAGGKTTAAPPFINAQFTWKGASKPPVSSFYVGTSPAFEMALYTACFFGEPGDCTCTIDGQQLMVKTSNFNNAGMVLTSYPTA
ncbi:hypothetical protein OS493_011175 [Desmophyllum pertusum]|uniref:Uridylate-specific endoribonuclease n=1 Tax=Desmophyllum pertusum TaxID=174260 RepID=A0A9W9Z256_9CNID|nr:hypothetical protein OS493_011175 [Desmophyllum pertusum]